MPAIRQRKRPQLMSTFMRADDEPQVFEQMHSRAWMKAMHPDTVVLCDSNDDVLQPAAPLKYVDRFLAVMAPSEPARWRWAEKDLE